MLLGYGAGRGRPSLGCSLSRPCWAYSGTLGGAEAGLALRGHGRRPLVGRGWVVRRGEHGGPVQHGAFARPPPLGLSWEGMPGPRAWGPQPPPHLLLSGPCDKAVV